MEDQMTESTLAKKMKLKPGLSAVVINAPDKYLNELKHDLEISESLSGKYDWIQIFVKSKAELDKLFPKVLKLLKPESIVWISFPKGSSKIQTDLTRDKGWDVIVAAELKWINLVSVNETWSTLRCVHIKRARQGSHFVKRINH
jgi:hypothetical protein